MLLLRLLIPCWLNTLHVKVLLIRAAISTQVFLQRKPNRKLRIKALASNYRQCKNCKGKCASRLAILGYIHPCTFAPSLTARIWLYFILHKWIPHRWIFAFFGCTLGKRGGGRNNNDEVVKLVIVNLLMMVSLIWLRSLRTFVFFHWKFKPRNAQLFEP